MVKCGCGESPNYWAIPSAVPLFWELKQFSLWMLAMLCYCPAGVFLIIIDLVTKSSLAHKALAHPSRCIIASMALLYLNEDCIFVFILEISFERRLIFSADFGIS